MTGPEKFRNNSNHPTAKKNPVVETMSHGSDHLACGGEISEKEGVGSANGSFGELLQGALTGPENHFLVTLPIACYSTARYRSGGRGSLTVFPRHKVKSLAMANMVLNHFGLPQAGELIIESDLPEGKGLSSSSADLVATARAVADCCGELLTPKRVLSFLKGIEPTDGIMYRGSVFFYHRKVKLGRHLGCLPPLEILALDEGGEVDTVQYNRQLPMVSKARKQLYGKLLKRISEAIGVQNLKELGKVSTQSALLNQHYLPKKNLQRVIAICEEIGGLGVVITHSGSYLGILLAQQDPAFREKKTWGLSLLTNISSNVSSFLTTDTNSMMPPMQNHTPLDCRVHNHPARAFKTESSIG